MWRQKRITSKIPRDFFNSNFEVCEDEVAEENRKMRHCFECQRNLETFSVVK